MNRFGKGTENDTFLGQLLLKGRADGNAIKDGIDGDAGQSLPLLQRNAQLLIGLQQFGIDFIEALRSVALLFRGRVIN